MKIGYKIWSWGFKHARGKSALLSAILLFLAIPGVLFLGTQDKGRIMNCKNIIFYLTQSRRDR